MVIKTYLIYNYFGRHIHLENQTSEAVPSTAMILNKDILLFIEELMKPWQLVFRAGKRLHFATNFDSTKSGLKLRLND